MSDSFVKRLGRDESGQTLVLAAIMLPVLIGFVGFAIDVGYAFDYKKQMQLAADSGAMAGAMAVKANPSINSGELAAVVTLDTANNGFTHGNAGIAVTVCRPGVDASCPTTYTYAADDGGVKVSIRQTRDTFFTKILSFSSITIGADAVAAKATSSGNTSNIVILDTGCTKGLDVNGGFTLTLNGSIYVNACGADAAQVGGGGAVNAAGGIFVACNSSGACGGYQELGGATFSPTPSTGNPQIADPLAGLPEPTPYGLARANPNISSGTATVQPGIYSDGLTITGGTVTFEPGDYFINGNMLEFRNNASVSGTGVFFYAYNDAELNIANPGTTVAMSAPTSGTYRGIWYFQQRSNAHDALIRAGATININGVIYVSNPGSRLTFSGGAGSGLSAQYTVFVVWRLLMGGGGHFGRDFSSIGNSSPLAGGSAGLALAE